MCNSWNHSLDCRCGFGGEGHLGRNYGSRLFENNFLGQPVTYESFVNPNARCPVCREPVFFYQSPYGGKVFFDELGHPWLKHPCTDNSLQNLTGKIDIEPINDEVFPNLNNSQSWKQNSWEPLVCFKLEVDYDIDRIKFIGYLSKYAGYIESNFSTWKNGYQYELYSASEIPLITLSVKDISKWIQNKSCIFTIYPTFIRKNMSSKNHYELSSFKVNKDGNIEVLHTNEAYIIQASIEDFIPQSQVLQRKRVYDGSPEEKEILKKWGIDLHTLTKIKIQRILLASYPGGVSKEKFEELSKLARKIVEESVDLLDDLDWRERVTKIIEGFPQKPRRFNFL